MPELIIIAGSSGSGKTTFIRTLEAGDADGMPEEIRCVGGGGWTHVNARQIGRRPIDPGDNVILHIDIARNFDSPDSGSLVEFIRRFERLYCVTLWAPYRVLKRRSRQRLFDAVRRHLRREGARIKTRRHLRIETRRHFRQTRRRPIRERYRRWFDFIDRLEPHAHWLVNSTSPDLSDPFPVDRAPDRPFGGRPFRR